MAELRELDERPGGLKGHDLLWSTKMGSPYAAIYETILPGLTLELVACYSCYCLRIGCMSSSMNTRDCERF